MQRFIREVNTTSRSCVLWDLEEETDYIIQVQSIGLYGESQASKKVHFRTLKKTDRFPSNSSNQGKLLYDMTKVIWKMIVWGFLEKKIKDFLKYAIEIVEAPCYVLAREHYESTAMLLALWGCT